MDFHVEDVKIHKIDVYLYKGFIVFLRPRREEEENLRPISRLRVPFGRRRHEYRTQIFMSACPFRAIEYRKTKKLPSKGIRQICGFSRL